MEEWEKRNDPTVTVEAVRLNEDNISSVGTWCGAGMVEEIDPEHPLETQMALNVVTPSGVQRASLGMYVVGYGKKFYVAHNRAFEMFYQPKTRLAPPPSSAGDARRERGFADPFDSGRFGP